MKRHFGVNPGKLYLTSDPVWTENISGKMISASLLANLGYLRDVLQRLAEGEDNLEVLLPDVWKASHPEHVRTFREEERKYRADQRHDRAAQRRLQAVTC